MDLPLLPTDEVLDPNGRWSGPGMLNGVRRRLPLGVRTDGVELLDSGRLSLPEVEQNLADLARLNRLSGGTAASIEAIRRLGGSDAELEVLDIGTGQADMPVRFAATGWRAVALDANPDVLLVARRKTSRSTGVEVVEGDARRLPFADGAFDVAHCSLLLHHLGPDDAATALREMARVARRGVVVNDLRRGVAPLVATMVTTVALARSHVSRSDALTSARRAYTLAELDALLASAGLTPLWRSTAWLPRVVTAATRS
jgi:SAM-dependent methyltransferase